MAKMTKSTTGARTAGPSKQYLQNGGTASTAPQANKRQQKRNEKRNEEMKKNAPVPYKKEDRDTTRTSPGGGAAMPLRKKQMGGSAAKASTSKVKDYLKDYNSDPSLPPGFKKRSKNPPVKTLYKKKGGMVKKQNGGAARDTTGMTFPYISPKGAIYSTGKDYMSGTPSSPTDPRNRDYMSKQDSTTQRKTGYTALTKGEKKKGGMVKKQDGGGIDFKKANDMFKKKSNQGGYNSDDIKKTLPGVKTQPSKPSKIYPPKPRKIGTNEIPYKKKGGMTKSKKK